MNNIKKYLIILLSLCMLFAIKTNYGGKISMRLNEPSSFSYTSSNYSNLIFCSLIHENFFYLKANGDIFSNIFKDYRYDKQKKALFLILKNNLSFSNGKAITEKNIKLSLKLFLSLNLVSSKKISRIIKKVRTEKNEIIVELLFDRPDIISLLTTPGLILISENDQVFSGIYYPIEWEKSKYIILKPNKYYPGGRTYLDSIKIVFFDYYYPEIFLAKPGLENSKFAEFNAGIYQNVYICFPKGDIGQNTRVALYFLLKDYFKTTDLVELNSLTSDEESPVSINIKRFPSAKVRSILKYSKIKLYVLSSLKELLKKFYEFLETRGLRIETISISNSQLINFLNDTSIKYLLLEKVFKRQMPLEEKIKKILKEMSFARFNEKYLKLINELDEVKFLKNDELLINQISKIIEIIIKDGLILPIFQKKYSLYINNKVQGIELDFYGRPLFQRVKIEGN